MIISQVNTMAMVCHTQPTTSMMCSRHQLPSHWDRESQSLPTQKPIKNQAGVFESHRWTLGVPSTFQQTTHKDRFSEGIHEVFLLGNGRGVSQRTITYDNRFCWLKVVEVLVCFSQSKDTTCFFLKMFFWVHLRKSKIARWKNPGKSSSTSFINHPTPLPLIRTQPIPWEFLNVMHPQIS